MAEWGGPARRDPNGRRIKALGIAHIQNLGREKASAIPNTRFMVSV